MTLPQEPNLYDRAKQALAGADGKGLEGIRVTGIRSAHNGKPAAHVAITPNTSADIVAEAETRLDGIPHEMQWRGPPRLDQKAVRPAGTQPANPERKRGIGGFLMRLIS